MCACMQVDVHVCTCACVSVNTRLHVHGEPAHVCMYMSVCDKGDDAALPSNGQKLARTAFYTKMGMQVKLHMTADRSALLVQHKSIGVGGKVRASLSTVVLRQQLVGTCTCYH